MRAILVGAVEGTQVALRAIAAAADWELVALVTLPPQLASRHSDFVDLSKDAQAIGARIIHAANSNSPDVVDAVAELSPDHVFVIGWSQICGPAFCEAGGGRLIGYHPAPLPRLRGRAVIPWTILLDEKITASTLFWIDEGVDSGPVLAQHFFHVAPDETAQSLYAKHMAALGVMLAETLPLIARGRAPREPQNETVATWAARRRPSDGLLDWNRPAAEIWRLIRAVGRPYPGAFTHSGSEQITIWSAEPWSLATRNHALPGQVIAKDDQSFVVGCGDGGALRVVEFGSPSGRAPPLHGQLGRE